MLLLRVFIFGQVSVYLHAYLCLTYYNVIIWHQKLKSKKYLCLYLKEGMHLHFILIFSVSVFEPNSAV